MSLEEGRKKNLLDEASFRPGESGRRRPSSGGPKKPRDRRLRHLLEALNKPRDQRFPFGPVREVHDRVSGPSADRLLAEFEETRPVSWFCGPSGGTAA